MQKVKGYTIVEVLVALAIFTIVFLGLFATVSVVISNNLENLKRNEATRLLEESLESIRNFNFSRITNSTLNNGISSCTDSLKNHPIWRQIRNLKAKFGIFYNVYKISPTLKKVRVEICWENKGKINKISDETLIGIEK